ncbi:MULTISPECIES: 3-oxoacyl-[acyl-carrier-protein] reductase [Chryseobacterium]|jgi:3-oxoacyl-[acyl-carrier protein] reductase|uniref:3-oxoacyl-[acyl-carrier-protein] reductase n=1 Tax=Chryseobacterium rhizosphaerae TaxID=395937 RepID=A0AAE4C383_9FLAO|nr:MULTISPECIES: 3-oxoacyl-[acyl-carrier-protein] reductase [Chryseobacterium]MBL3549689.1 3-oxoacyl-[acyl-carrier-protein] reductase [Chryseobacterium sp. KMC2]MDC8102454.1 3-oxoacyl-[acyl-carrier-protein] reductase [Chryseobacterium rhizosphaerae]MDR6526637.1 3-oxoacyl-[acyl-carrier protein] reductase [Chryseobacterium rhizosphaerae]MDR6544783.1 3-oxoacyl-[acyl-carrier protein] reductase [Chryseobacterium rhizosphaerae]REC77890.1 3-oxoacyl-[acyl-carrier-protein] reductase [Chryseobacterium r
MKLLEGKVALITGATRGIGKGIAEVFAQHGAKIAFTYAGSVDKAKELEASLSSVTQIKGYQSDASDYDAAQQLVDDVMKEFGQIDILINNAGITKDNLLLRMSKEDWDQVLRVNLDSVFNLTKAVIKPMMKARSGSIINMTSVVGIKGHAGQANYAASKAGVIGFTKSVALELGSRNIRCNAIAPGFIETEMTAVLDEKIVQEWREGIPMKRGGQPADVANACVFLGSEMASYISGQTLNVDGGMLT